MDKNVSRETFWYELRFVKKDFGKAAARCGTVIWDELNNAIVSSFGPAF